MSYHGRQEVNVNVGVYVFNGGYRPFVNSPVTLECWNLDATAALEFMGGQAVTIALDGFEYGNGEGYRLTISADVNNIYDLSEQLSWRSLFELLAGQYDKLFATLTTNSTGSPSTSMRFTEAASATNDFYNGLVVTNAGGINAVVTDYTGSNRTATLNTALTWTNAVAINVTAKPNLQRVIGLSITGEDADRIYYNLDGNAFGILKQFTIGRQVINFRLRSVERYSTIPESFVLNG